MDYKFNKKSWMTSKIFEEHLRKLDRQFRFEKRQVAFILDNCSAHSRLTNLTNITLFFNHQTTSISQPMDAGVIRNLSFVQITTCSQENQVLGFENRF